MLNLRSNSILLAAMMVMALCLPLARAADDSIILRMLPENAGTYGDKVDQLYVTLTYLTGAAFAAVVAAMAYFCVRYRHRAGRRAYYTHGDSWGALGVTGTLALLVFLGIDMNVVHLSNAAAREMQSPPPDAMRVRVLAQQFTWGFHYPGPDGKYGKCDLAKADNFNLFGLDDKDPDGKDDVIAEGLLCVPVHRPVVLELRSKDVIHSFFLPMFRAKQDVVPGMKTTLWFEATREGEFEIACAELCGMMHSQMAGWLRVTGDAAYKAWYEMKLDNKE